VKAAGKTFHFGKKRSKPGRSEKARLESGGRGDWDGLFLGKGDRGGFLQKKKKEKLQTNDRIRSPCLGLIHFNKFKNRQQRGGKRPSAEAKSR